MGARIATFRTRAFVFGVGEIVVMVEPEELGVGRASADDEKSLFGSRAIREGVRWAVLRPAVLAESVA